MSAELKPCRFDDESSEGDFCHEHQSRAVHHRVERCEEMLVNERHHLIPDETDRLRVELETIKKVAQENADIANERGGIIINIRAEVAALTARLNETWYEPKEHGPDAWTVPTAEAYGRVCVLLRKSEAALKDCLDDMMDSTQGDWAAGGATQEVYDHGRAILAGGSKTKPCDDCRAGTAAHELCQRLLSLGWAPTGNL